MISADHVRLMARYNRWQNENLYQAASGLSDAARREDRGAFFGSIHRTLSHLLWGDSVWMSRFAGTPKPSQALKDSPDICSDWQELVVQRTALDATIIAWAGSVTTDWLAGETGWYSGALGREMKRPNWLLATHFFNHQTHHRGQVHAMLTAAGAQPAIPT